MFSTDIFYPQHREHLFSDRICGIPKKKNRMAFTTILICKHYPLTTACRWREFLCRKLPHNLVKYMDIWKQSGNSDFRQELGCLSLLKYSWFCLLMCVCLVGQRQRLKHKAPIPHQEALSISYYGCEWVRSESCWHSFRQNGWQTDSFGAAGRNWNNNR